MDSITYQIKIQELYAVYKFLIFLAISYYKVYHCIY